MARQSTGQVVERRGKRGRSFALGFRAYGRRHYLTLGTADEGWTRQRAELELSNVLADVRRGIWRPPEPERAEEPRVAPTFHAFASEWVAAREHEVETRTAEFWRWALTCHLLPFFAGYRLTDLTAVLVDRYRTGKVRERELGLVERPLSNGSINKTLKVLAQVLEAAVEYGHLPANPASGKRRRLKARKPRRTWLEADEVRSLLSAAGKGRPLLATMVLAGLRVGEATALRWRDVDLARGRLLVRTSKTDAGRRTVDLSPDLIEELKLYRAGCRDDGAEALVFATSRGTALHRANVSNRILANAIERANEARKAAGLEPIEDGVTNHTLRRTFASLLYEAGASPAYVMAQMGHTSAALALEVYARKMERQRDTGARLDALVRGAEWAQAGTNSIPVSASVVSLETEKPPFAATS
jgi:integrase